MPIAIATPPACDYHRFLAIVATGDNCPCRSSQLDLSAIASDNRFSPLQITVFIATLVLSQI